MNTVMCTCTGKGGHVDNYSIFNCYILTVMYQWLGSSYLVFLVFTCRATFLPVIDKAAVLFGVVFMCPTKQATKQCVWLF